MLAACHGECKIANAQGRSACSFSENASSVKVQPQCRSGLAYSKIERVYWIEKSNWIEIVGGGWGPLCIEENHRGSRGIFSLLIT